jgi:hypothetical protein
MSNATFGFGEVQAVEEFVMAKLLILGSFRPESEAKLGQGLK